MDNRRKIFILAGLLAVLGLILGRNMALKVIKQFEGLSLVPYKDTGGVWTIGYGHKILPSEQYYPYGPVKEITVQEADNLLGQDTHTASNAIADYVTVPLTANQKDALTSFAYNVGVNAFAGSTLLKKLNAGDYQGAANEFLKWNHDNGVVVAGLTARREAERNLFLT